MKRYILLFLSFIILFACGKSNSTISPKDPPSTEDSLKTEDSIITALKAHVWLFDSLEKVHNGIAEDSLIADSPKIEMRFTTNQLYFSYPGGLQNDAYIYEVNGNKLYRWREGSPIHNYFIIQQLTDKLFVLSTHDEEYLEYDYYSAKP